MIGVTMAVGPFFVFTPIKPIKLKKETLLKKIATVARKKSSRTIVFVLFCVLTAMQGLVAYDIFELMGAFGLSTDQQVLTVFGYCLVALFYLMVFYSTVLGRTFVYNDIDMVEHIRTNSFIEFRRRLHVLSGSSDALGFFQRHSLSSYCFE
jgi:hypothetical protein